MASLRSVCMWRSRSYALRARTVLSSEWSGQARRSLRISATALGTEKELEEAKQRVLTLTQDPGNDVKLRLYGLFKQATIGPCNVAKPGAFDFVGKAKWSAWNQLKDLGKSDAVDQYCLLVDELVGGQPPPSSEEQSSSATASYQEIVVTDDGGIRTILLNRPAKKNAMNYQMYSEVQEALRIAGQDTRVAVAVITGAGDYYCSGNDLTNFLDIPPEGPAKLAAQARGILLDFVSAFIRFPKPLIAAVNGPAVGLSVTLLGLCDLVYAADNATFHTPFMQLGQSPEACSSYLFPMIMGPAKANEVLLAGRKLTATEAFERGLVTAVFQQAEFSERMKEVLSHMASMPPVSLQKSKELMRKATIATLEEVNARECELLEERWLSEECMKAIMNFMQRRK